MSASITPPNTHNLVEGPSAWYSKSFNEEIAARSDESKQWIYTFSEADLEDLDKAIVAFRKTGIEDLADINIQNFPLGQFGVKLLAIQKEIVWGRGFVLFRGFPLDKYDRRDGAAAFLGLGAYFGEPVSQNGKGHVLGHVRDLGNDPLSPLTRLYTTNAKHRFHTDSCDIVGLLCLRPAKEGGLSSISSSVTVYNEMLKNRPDLLDELVKPLCWDRKGEIPEGKQAYWLQPVFHEHNDQNHHRLVSTLYDRSFFTYRFDEIGPATAKQTEAMDYFESLASSDALRIDMELRRGDMQFLHNHTILHSRTAYVDHDEPELKRHLLRLWLSAPNGRPLPTEFKERYGNIEVGTKRGGIIVPGIQLHAPVEADGTQVRH